MAHNVEEIDCHGIQFLEATRTLFVHSLVKFLLMWRCFKFTTT